MTTRRCLHVEQLHSPAVSEVEVEFVERKGLGHPDSLIDGASESVSRGLCRFYLKEFGTIFHHNVDKGLLVGGRSNPRFGGGEVLEPVYMLVAGRATTSIRHEGRTLEVPVGEIAESSIKGFLKDSMRYLDPEKHVKIGHMIRQGSSDLVAIYERARNIPIANDTSIGVGYAPLTPCERLVLETERYLNSKGLKRELPEVGEDIKVMALRKNREIDLTLAVAMISSHTPDHSHYINVVEEVKRRVEDLAERVTGMPVNVMVNTGDDYSKGEFYLTVTGTSAEAGDDGNTGRGNRPHGLITPMRQYSMEATAGKNPVSHTGKVYNVLAQRAAERISREVQGVWEVYVRVLSRIGSPIDQPQIASAAVLLEPNTSFTNFRAEIESILNDELDHVTSLTDLILSGAVTLF